MLFNAIESDFMYSYFCCPLTVSANSECSL